MKSTQRKTQLGEVSQGDRDYFRRLGEANAAGDPTAASERKVFLAGLPILATTKEAEALAYALLSAMALPQSAALDALHIGLAAVNGIDILLTWNCAHIANPFMQPQISVACVEFGVIPPTICTPLQLVEA